MKSLKEKWLSIVQLAREKGENGIGGSSTITDGMGGSLKVVAPMAKGVDNGEQLSIVNVVVAFSRREGLGEISARVKISITVSLYKHSSTGKKRCVCHDNKQLLGVGEV